MIIESVDWKLFFSSIIEEKKKRVDYRVVPVKGGSCDVIAIECNKKKLRSWSIGGRMAGYECAQRATSGKWVGVIFRKFLARILLGKSNTFFIN
jgi:hypothetical protein